MFIHKRIFIFLKNSSKAFPSPGKTFELYTLEIIIPPFLILDKRT